MNLCCAAKQVASRLGALPPMYQVVQEEVKKCLTIRQIVDLSERYHTFLFICDVPFSTASLLVAPYKGVVHLSSLLTEIV